MSESAKKEIKRIAVFTSGGDAPGMNAAIRAVVRTASFNDLHIYGIRRGYDGMIKGDIFRIERREVGNILHRGGTVLKTARSEQFRTKEGRQSAFESLMAHDIDACVAIGGNGTFTGAHIFSKEHNIPMVGIPGTIDNDLYGTDYTIGYDTAVNTAIDAVDKIRDTADSHNRLFFVEVMGRNSGFIALSTGIGTGAGMVLTPEYQRSIDDIIIKLKKDAKRKKMFSLIVVAEGNKDGGAMEIAAKVKEKFDHYEIKVAIIGHLQRGGSPTAADRVLASRLGFAAVEGLLAGKSNVMAGLVNNKVKFTSFKDAITKEKRIPEEMVRLAGILSV
ncbi:MAG: 6-phosphofructokinase [Saprospiraceae bacterium]